MLKQIHKNIHPASERLHCATKSENSEPKVASLRQFAKMCSIIKNERDAFSNI